MFKSPLYFCFWLDFGEEYYYKGFVTFLLNVFKILFLLMILGDPIYFNFFSKSYRQIYYYSGFVNKL